MKPRQKWAYDRLLERAEAYKKDAKASLALGWKASARNKINNAEFCLTLAEHIRLGIQEF